METDDVLYLYENLFDDFNKMISLGHIVSNDNSTMRAILKHISNHPKGRLKDEIHQPEWYANPSHRTKVVAKLIFNLVTAPKSKSLCMKDDNIIFKKYYGYMIKTNKDKTISGIERSSKAAIEHLFNSHENCDPAWGRPKYNLQRFNKNKANEELDKDKNKNSNDEEEQQRTSKSFYRCKRKDSTLYRYMWEVYLPFTRRERLKKSLYQFPTQKMRH